MTLGFFNVPLVGSTRTRIDHKGAATLGAFLIFGILTRALIFVYLGIALEKTIGYSDSNPLLAHTSNVVISVNSYVRTSARLLAALMVCLLALLSALGMIIKMHPGDECLDGCRYPQTIF